MSTDFSNKISPIFSEKYFGKFFFAAKMEGPESVVRFLSGKRVHEPGPVQHKLFTSL